MILWWPVRPKTAGRPWIWCGARPDVVLMDIRMPRLDGIAALRMIVGDTTLAGVRVIMLTTFELDEYVFEALQAGAAGF